MKAHKPQRSKSFLRTCIVYFLLCSLAVFGMSAASSFLLSLRLDHAFPSLGAFLQYEDELSADDFSAVPLQRFPNCAYLVFDQDGGLLYASDIELRDSIHAEDLWMIPTEDLYYVVSSATDQTGRALTYIALYFDDGITNEFIDHCVVDASYNIVEGSLFPGIEQLSERQLMLLQGIYRSNYDLIRYQYSATDGSDRTLVFVSPQLTEQSYAQMVEQTDRLWPLSILALLAAVLILALLFRRQIQQAIHPLHQAILAYGAGKRVEVNRNAMPREFLQVTDSFTHLLDQLEQASAAREQADREKQRVIADLSHDLKTPLTVIRGYAQALSDGVVPPEKQAQYLDAILRRANAGAELIDTLFAYSQLDHPDYVLQAERLDLCAFVRDYLAEKYTELENAGFSLTAELPETPLFCQADPRLLRRLLENLTNNALKYNPRGTTLLYALRRQADMLYLTVADNGVGIPPHLAAHLFEPFVTGNEARTTGCGTGLGTAIVQRIVSLHGGDVRLVQPPRAGYKTEFEITLPYDGH